MKTFGMIDLWKDYSPLEGCTMKMLALAAVTVLGVERIAVKLESNVSTPALSESIAICILYEAQPADRKSVV